MNPGLSLVVNLLLLLFLLGLICMTIRLSVKSTQAAVTAHALCWMWVRYHLCCSVWLQCLGILFPVSTDTLCSSFQPFTTVKWLLTELVMWDKKPLIIIVSLGFSVCVSEWECVFFIDFCWSLTCTAGGTVTRQSKVSVHRWQELLETC